MAKTRKQIRCTPSERIRLRAHADKEDRSASAIVGSWLEDFLKNGTDAEKAIRLDFMVDPDLLAAAEKKAREEYDMPISDIIHHEIARLR